MNWSDVTFSAPQMAATSEHHVQAAQGNAQAGLAAWSALRATLESGADRGTTHLLLEAAAGAGKSYVLRDLVTRAAGDPGTRRVGVTAFTNNQIRPLALGLAKQLGAQRVALHVSRTVDRDLSDDVRRAVTVTSTASQIPSTVDVVLTTASKLKAPGEPGRIKKSLGATEDDTLYDVLFVDEAWQLAHHLFDPIAKVAPVIVGVGDVGQLPPLEIGASPWRGDRHNPYRAWPVAFLGRESTWSRKLPAVWRPPAEAVALWRAFYPDFGDLASVAAEGERRVAVHGDSDTAPLWRQVGTGTPTLVEVDGLAPSDAPDVDKPLLDALEAWLTDLFQAGFTVESADYDGDGAPTGQVTSRVPGETSEDDDPLVVILATRNQAVDDAQEIVDRLRVRFGLGERDLVASTVDSWQGQTNAITIAIHPLNGATELDDFNSAFGRLAVACTRATHGVLMLARGGLDDLLELAPARPGTPFGEPGTRALPRQTHQRILSAFARGRITVTD